jgi:hypothetical protein
MIRLPDIALPPVAAEGLRAYQEQLDSGATYAERVAMGKEAFKARNRRGNLVFDEIKHSLDKMCPGIRRCAFCEDSLADEVEHFRPKDLYPQHVFCWPNYLYACGRCNRHKNSKFAVFPPETVEILDVSRKRNAPIVEPVAGDEVLIDPRAVDAMGWMKLELIESFYFVPLASEGNRHHARAAYTISALGLNRDALPAARRQAYVNYQNALRRYLHEKQEGAALSDREQAIADLKRNSHPTVWREMQRQHPKIPALQKLFAAAPEALSW